MNVGTGMVTALESLTEAQRKSGEWVEVSDEVAAAALTVDLEGVAERVGRDPEGMRRQLEALRKEGRR